MFSLLQVSNSFTVLAQAATGESSSVVGWLIVLVLAAIFAGFVFSILRTKPIDPASLASDDNASTKPEVAPENNLVSERHAASSATAVSATSSVKEERYVSSEPAAPKMKGLKGKKKLQKKKLNAQRTTTTATSPSVSSSAKNDETVYQPRVAEYTPSSSTAAAMTDSPSEGLAATESTEAPVEPVRIASTYAINAMANKPRATIKPKEANEKKAANKGAVQGFHKMDRYREPIRTVDVSISTPAAPRTELQSASVGEEGISRKENSRKEERRDRRPRREPAKPAPADAEGPRTLKDFLSKKPGEE